ncbi:helix-turn-helix transcriptional regulator [Salinicola aestuarinus]|uniref:helix-turn-helix transcriptional regulator n=1 Tax=Salinicola aestuarinus TaxID=1949082 RepID=UPI001FD98D01|nr:AraC family transcriptional regulator [Salinicola aestuarinus]
MKQPDVPPASRALTVDDFDHFERRYRVEHRFAAPLPPSSAADAIAEGRVEEQRLATGWQWVGSDLCIHRTYETHALPDAPAHLSVILMLEGEATITLGEHTHHLQTGAGLLLAYPGAGRLTARHAAQPRVRAINLTIPVSALAADTRLEPLRPRLNASGGGWPLVAGAGLQASLAHWLDHAPQPGAALLAEGLALQLLAAAAAVSPGGALPPSSARHGDRLARVHRLIQSRPGEDYTLASLARLACMSSSSLRSKYRQRYGLSLFDHLRQCRLELAHRLLKEGGEVQEVAYCVGYRHPSNFATAFRRHHGLAPRDIVNTARVP